MTARSPFFKSDNLITLSAHPKTFQVLVSPFHHSVVYVAEPQFVCGYKTDANACHYAIGDCITEKTVENVDDQHWKQENRETHNKLEIIVLHSVTADKLCVEWYGSLVVYRKLEYHEVLEACREESV